MKFFVQHEENDTFDFAPQLLPWRRFFEALGLEPGCLSIQEESGDQPSPKGLFIPGWDAFVLSEPENPSEDLLALARGLHEKTGQKVLAIEGIPQPGEYTMTLLGMDDYVQAAGPNTGIWQFLQCRCCDRIELVHLDRPATDRDIEHCCINCWAPGVLYGRENHACPNCTSENIRGPMVTDALRVAYACEHQG